MRLRWQIIMQISRICGLLLLFLMQSAMAASEFKIFTLHHRFAEDIIDSVRPFVGNDGSATAIQNQLIIRASPQHMRDIETLVTQLDRTRQNFTVSVRYSLDAQTQNKSIAITGRQGLGKIETRTQAIAQDAPDAIALSLENRKTNTQRQQQQVLRVIDGEAAFIQVGQSVPFSQTWVSLASQYQTLVRITEYVDLSTGFAVRARSIGDEIELRITPRILQLNTTGVIDFETLTTIVRVKSGEWLNIGGIMQENDAVSRAILAHQSTQNRTTSELIIRVD